MSGGWAVELGQVCGARGRCPVPSSTPAPPSLLWVWKGCRAVVHHRRTPRRPSPCPSAIGGGSPPLLGLSRAAPRGTGVGGWWERRPTPVAVHSPAGEDPQGPVSAKRPPQTRMPAQLWALQRLPGGHGKPLPDAPGRGGGGAGQLARLGCSCAGFPGLGTPPPRPHSWACGADHSGGSGQLRTGVGPAPAPMHQLLPACLLPQASFSLSGGAGPAETLMPWGCALDAHALPHWTVCPGIPQKSVGRSWG